VLLRSFSMGVKSFKALSQQNRRDQSWMMLADLGFGLKVGV
jgi:hypothetical protein